MDPAWVGVVGTVCGGVVGVLGTWVAQQSSRSAAARAERRDAYADFLEHANRGIRSVESLRRYLRWQSEAEAATAEGRKPVRLPSADSLVQVRDEVDDFVNGLDRSLVVVQLLAPVRLLEAARHLHDGIYYFDDDEISSEDLSERFKSFVSIAHADLTVRSPLRRGLKLNRPIGIPIRSAAAEPKD